MNYSHVWTCPNVIVVWHRIFVTWYPILKQTEIWCVKLKKKINNRNNKIIKKFKDNKTVINIIFRAYFLTVIGKNDWWILQHETRRTVQHCITNNYSSIISSIYICLLCYDESFEENKSGSTTMQLMQSVFFKKLSKVVDAIRCCNSNKNGVRAWETT